MKSKAQVKGHPLHPMLIPFPIAFLVGTLVFDILGIACNDPGYRQTAKYLEIAGVVMALVAAIPGAVDYFGTVPPQSSGKKRATQHALINIFVVVIFAIAFCVRDNASASVVLVLEIVGVILLCIAGWLGATLVYRNQIGVDPRYANAGKWKETFVDDNKGLIEVGTEDELQTNQMKLVHIGAKRIVVGKTETGYVAFADHCTHRGGSLAGGAMICGTVQCPWHGSQFDCKTGAVKAGPATDTIQVYPVEVKNGKLYVNY